MSEVNPVITKVMDSATDELTPKAKGIIKRISIKQINADGSAKISTIPSGPKKGTQIRTTHRYSILLESGTDLAWVNVGEEEVKNQAYVDQFQIKVGDKYVNLYPGMEISIYPVEIREYKAKNPQGVEEDRIAYQGRKNKIKLLNDNGITKESSVAQASTHKSPSASTNASGNTKVYGEIKAITDGVATVSDEKAGEVKVVLGDNLSAVQVGGRLTAFIDAGGVIKSGFKAYGPVIQGEAGKVTGGAGKASGFRKDDLPIRLGNAVSITHAMLPKLNPNEAKFGEAVKMVLTSMGAARAVVDVEFKDSSMDAYSIGARLGQSGIVQGPFHKVTDLAAFEAAVVQTFRNITALEAIVREADKPVEQKQEPEVVSEQKTTESVVPPVENPPVESYADMDFDSDIPF